MRQEPRWNVYTSWKIEKLLFGEFENGGMVCFVSKAGGRTKTHAVRILELQEKNFATSDEKLIEKQQPS